MEWGEREQLIICRLVSTSWEWVNPLLFRHRNHPYRLLFFETEHPELLEDVSSHATAIRDVFSGRSNRRNCVSLCGLGSKPNRPSCRHLWGLDADHLIAHHGIKFSSNTGLPLHPVSVLETTVGNSSRMCLCPYRSSLHGLYSRLSFFEPVPHK